MLKSTVILLLSALILGSAEFAAAGPKRDLVLLLDISLSMRAADPQGRVTDVVRNLLQYLPPDTWVALITYGDFTSVVRSLSALSGGSERAGPEIDPEIKDALRYQHKTSNSAAGLERAIYELRERGRGGAHKTLLWISGSRINTGDAREDADFKTWAREVLSADAARSHIKVTGLALGDAAGRELARDMAERTGGEYIVVKDVDALAAELAKLNGVRLQQLMATKERSQAVERQTPMAKSPPPNGGSASVPTESSSMPRESQTGSVQKPVPVPAGDEPSATPSPEKSQAAPVPNSMPEAKTGFKTDAAPRSEPDSVQVPLSEPSEPLTDESLTSLPQTAQKQPDVRSPKGQAFVFSPLIFWLLGGVVAVSGLGILLLSLRGRRQGRTDTALPLVGATYRAALEDVDGISGQKRYDVTGTPVSFQRHAAPKDEAVAVIIDQDTISREHASIRYVDGIYRIRDNESINGTFVNDKKITAETQLQSGDLIRIAVYSFRFLLQPISAMAANEKTDTVGVISSVTAVPVSASLIPDTKNMSGDPAVTAPAGAIDGSELTLRPPVLTEHDRAEEKREKKSPDMTGGEGEKTVIRPAE